MLVGYGRVGRHIGEALRANGLTCVVVEENREVVERLRAEGALAVWGDGTEPAVLVQAHIARARDLVIVTGALPRTRQMVDIARRLNPRIRATARAHNDQEAALMRQEHVDRVFVGAEELANSMIQSLLQRSAAAYHGEPAR